MTELFTQTTLEDAVGRTNDFLAYERGSQLDGGQVGSELSQRIEQVAHRAERLLQSSPHPRLTGLFVPLSRRNPEDFAEVVTVLPGYILLVASSMIESSGPSVFYPAVVSEDGLKSSSVRLHILRQPYLKSITTRASVILAAAGQSEAPGVGGHGNTTSIGVEAEHFPTLLAAASDQNILNDWKTGQHVNHAWRQRPNSSVSSEVSKRLFGNEVPQITRTINKQDILDGKAALLWHAGMINPSTGKPETAARDNALVIMQGLGFQAVQASNPSGIDHIKRMIA